MNTAEPEASRPSSPSDDTTRAEEITVEQGGINRAEAQVIHVRDGGIVIAQAQEINLTDGGAVVMAAEKAHIQDSGVIFLASSEVTGENVTVLFDVRAAAILALLIGAIGVLYKLLTRHKP